MTREDSETQLWTVRRLQALERLSQVFSESADLEEIVRRSIDAIFSVFESDRAWLVFPCDPGITEWQVLYETTRPEFPGAAEKGRTFPVDPSTRKIFNTALNTTDAVVYTRVDHPWSGQQEFDIQTQMNVAIRPRIGKPWLLGLHQCSYPRQWSEKEKQLFVELSHRLGEALSQFLFLKSLRESEANFRALAENAQVGIVIVDSRGRFSFANQRAADMVKRSPDQVSDISIQDVIAPEDLPTVLKRLSDRMKGVHVSDAMEAHLLCSDGSKTPVDAVGARTTWQGEPSNLIIMRDISAWKRLDEERATLLAREQSARAEAENANRMKDLFLATISHELRTPLTTIMTWSQLLGRGRIAPEKVGHALDMIEKAAKAQNQLIEDLLDVSRIVTNKVRLQLEVLDGVPLLGALIDEFKPIVSEKGLLLECSLPSAAVPLRVDPTRFRQIFANLINNAIKYTPSGGTISVVMACGPAGEAEIKVQDTGIGIEPVFLPRLFERFSQMDSSISRRAGGLGLGLAIVKHLVELHGGKVRAESEGTNRGTCFLVVLPGANEALPSIDRQASSALACDVLKGLEILLVEDEDGIREAVAAALGIMGAQVETASSGAEGLRRFQQSRPQLILADLAMPKMDGFMFLAALREMKDSGRVPCIAVSALAGLDVENRALKSGFDAFVSKPIDMDALVRAIQKLKASQN